MPVDGMFSLMNVVRKESSPSMRSKYLVPASLSSISEEIRKSRFLSFIQHTPDRCAAREWMAAIRAEHPQARHCCWASLSGNPDDSQCLGFSDDGEPSGTAGRPLLQLLQGSGLGEVTAMVVRYYGGIKLGTGGLVRAYSSGIGQLLKTLPTREVQLGLEFTLACGYDELALCQHLLQEVGCQQVVIEYLEQVLVRGECPIDKVEILGRWLNDRSQGRLRPVWLKD